MIEILKLNIFDEKRVFAGITKRNLQNYSPYGFTISNAKIVDNIKLESNRMDLAKFLGISRNNIAFQKQIHSDIIRVMSSENNVISESDAMITNEKNFFISISIADCAALLIFDPINEIIAGVHSGWRGTQQKIAIKTIFRMNELFNSKAEDLLIYISPCASGDNYEVDKEFLEYFPNSVKSLSNEKYLFDNKKELKSQLISIGVEERNLEISTICTIGDTQYHSYRRDKDISGRMSAFIGMIK